MQLTRWGSEDGYIKIKFFKVCESVCGALLKENYAFIQMFSEVYFKNTGVQIHKGQLLEKVESGRPPRERLKEGHLRDPTSGHKRSR